MDKLTQYYYSSSTGKFLRYQRIMDSYGDTKTAADIILHCDKWKIYAKYHKKN